MSKPLIIASLCLLLGWHLISYHPALTQLVPPPYHVIKHLLTSFPTFYPHLLQTLLELTLSLFFAFTVAFPLAFAMSTWQSLSHFIHPIMLLFQALPLIVLAPLMIFWFGFGLVPILLPATLFILFPLTLILYRGFTSTPEPLKDLFTLYRAKASKTFFHLTLPSSIPYLLTGAKVAFPSAVMGVVTSEWVGGQLGLGVLLLESKRAYELQTTYGCTLLIFLLSSSLFFVANLLDSFCSKYYAYRHTSS